MLKLAPQEVLPVKFLKRCGASDQGDEVDPLFEFVRRRAGG